MLHAKRLRRLCVLVLAALVSGCVMGPGYERPANDVPAAFRGSVGREPVLATRAWWLSLHDPLLNELMARAKKANPEVGRARAAVVEARASVAQAEAGGRPQLNATGSATFGRSFTPPRYYGNAAGYSTAGFDASWELDLWGKTHRLVEAASANAEAAQADADDVMLTLLGDVARNYVELRGIQSLIAITEVSLQNQRDANDLTTRRFTGGDGSKLEILQGSTLLSQQQAVIPMLKSEVEIRVDAISTLCGEPPDALMGSLSTPGPIPQGPTPDAGIPADLLRRRPDIRAAERQLAASMSLIGAAEADKYPTLSLSGSLSLGGQSPASILAAPLFALLPTFSVPVLDGGRRDAAVDIRKAQAEQARFAYRAVVLKALKEVQDAMARLQGETLHRDQLKRTVASAQKVVSTARALYTAGAAEFLQVLDAQRTLNETRNALVQAESARAVQLVALFKALGGGWDTP